MATGEPIAIVGMAGRFPGAESIDELADNLFNACDCISDLPDDTPFVDDLSVEYVRRRPLIKDADCFDADYFGLTPREAELRDPHHRLFLETAHAALAHGGYDGRAYPGRVGVFAGMNANRYRFDYLEVNPDLVRSAGYLAIDIASFPDYLSTFTSYKLGLRGPSITALSACSSSLVSVHLACTAIRAGECEMAIAGGASIEFPFNRGYFHFPGSTTAKDGVVRPFDEHTTGTNFGNGVGAVLLKPLPAALAERDTVYAVIRGSAVNNDADRKVGFAAPSVEGQRECIQAALRAAEVNPRDISYVEAHGTGTPVGDPIELAGLVAAFREVGGPDLPAGYCALGTVKSNVGHLGHSAGITGLIKTVLALHHERLPASINVTTPTTGTDWATSPFDLVTETRPWPAVDSQPRIAAVSSFGIGGTNAHVIVSEAPPTAPGKRPSRPAEAVLWSATDAHAFDRLRERLAGYFADLPPSRFADAAHTLRTGRTQKEVRGAVLAANSADAAESLGDSWRIIRNDGRRRSLSFAFPGQGAQFANMMADLYEDEHLFRDGCDAAFEVLAPMLDVDLRAAWDSGDEDRLAETVVAQPLLYVLEYTLAHCLLHWGAQPSAVFGHSLGELVAGAVAGVFDFESGLRAVAARARLMQDMPRGRMVAVGAGPDDVAHLISGPVALAAINGPRQVVLSGPEDAIGALTAELGDLGWSTRTLRTSHAFHSPAMADAASRWAEVLAGLDLREPTIPVVSAATGTVVAADDARSPLFWARQLTAPVDFDAAARQVLSGGPATILEVGPGRTIGALLRGRTDLRDEGSRVLPLAPRAGAGATEPALAQLWVDGVDISYWHELGDRGYRRIAAPGYPYARQRHWVDRPAEPSEPDAGTTGAEPATSPPDNRSRSTFAELAWHGTCIGRAAAEPARTTRGTAVVLRDPATDDRLVRALRRAGYRAVVLDAAPGRFDPTSGPAWTAALDAAGEVDVVVHAALLGSPASVTATDLDSQLDLSVYSVFACLRALVAASRRERRSVTLAVVGTHLVDVTGGEPVNPAAAAVVPLLRSIHREQPDIATHCLDVSPSTPEDVLVRELAELTEPLAALRGTTRWSPVVRRLPEDEAPLPLRHRGTYVVTGGLGGIGLVVAKALAQTGMRPRIALLGRTVPPVEELPELTELTAAGAEVELVRADVTDLDSLRAAIDAVEHRFGTVSGVVHSAGVPGGGLAARRDPAEIRRVLAPKTRGVLNLEQVFADRPELDFLVLFSSQAGLFGLYGSADYAAANAFLDAHARSASARDRRTLSVQWPGWSEVGMAARSNVDISALTGTPGVELERPELTHEYDTAGSWEFTEHVAGGRAVLPATALLELVVRAARRSRYGAHEPLELLNAVFLTPITGPGRVDVRVVLTPVADGHRFRVQARAAGAGGWTDHAHGTVGPAEPATGGDLAALRGRLSPEPFGGLATWIRYGERWQCVTDYLGGADECLARLVLPEKFQDDLAEHELHPALLDVATGMYTDASDDRAHAPFLYRELRIYGPLTGDVTVHARKTDPPGGERLRRTAVDIYDTETGTLLVQVVDFTLRTLSGSWRPATPPAVPAEPAPAAPDPSLIDAATGAELFTRLLAAALPPVVLVTTPGSPEVALAEPAAAVTPAPTEPVAAAPPSTTADAAAVLRDLWTKALGVANIGDDDDFFDLGGNSLTAVALTSHIRDHFGVELSAGVMFELSTIRAMAEELTR